MGNPGHIALRCAATRRARIAGNRTASAFCHVRGALARLRRSSRALCQQNQQTSSHQGNISYVEDSGSNRAKPDIKEVSCIAVCPTIDEIPDPSATDQGEPKDLKIAGPRSDKSV